MQISSNDEEFHFEAAGKNLSIASPKVNEYCAASDKDSALDQMNTEGSMQEFSMESHSPISEEMPADNPTPDQDVSCFENLKSQLS